MNKRLILKGVKFGKEDITTLQVRLISNTGLLNHKWICSEVSFSVVHFTDPLWILIFQFSCQYIEVQAQLACLFNLDGTNPRIPVTPIASFAANTNTEIAYKQFCKDLYQIGVKKGMIRRNEEKIQEILRSQDMVSSNQIGGSDIED